MDTDRKVIRDAPEPTGLLRRFGLLEATALNMTNIVAHGPFITIPLLLSTLGGPQAMLGWLVAFNHHDFGWNDLERTRRRHARFRWFLRLSP